MQNLLGAIDTELPPPPKKSVNLPHRSTVTDSSLSKHITSTPSPYTPNPKTTPLASTPLSKRGPHPLSPLFSGTDAFTGGLLAFEGGTSPQGKGSPFLHLSYPLIPLYLQGMALNPPTICALFHALFSLTNKGSVSAFFQFGI